MQQQHNVDSLMHPKVYFDIQNANVRFFGNHNRTCYKYIYIHISLDAMLVPFLIFLLITTLIGFEEKKILK